MLRLYRMPRLGQVFAVIMCLIMLFLAACRENTTTEDGTDIPADIPTTIPTAALPETNPTILPTITAVPATPTPTAPLAALVNDEPVYLTDYEKELARYEQAYVGLGYDFPPDYQSIVLNSLIERTLIVQAAMTEGIVVTPEMVDARLAEMRSEADGDENFAAWLEANQYTEAEFRTVLQADIFTAQMLDRVTADVPYAADQVHARYIQVNDEALAASLLEQLRNGGDFAQLAEQYSLDQVAAQAGGELGFFTLWSLQVPEVAEAAFALEPGEISDIITVTNADGSQTFYLVQVIEKESQRVLTAHMRYMLLDQTVAAWLQAQWDQASITRFVDIDG